jgi:hypothetical protein
MAKPLEKIKQNKKDKQKEVKKMLYLNRKKRSHFSRVFILTGKIIRGIIKISRADDVADSAEFAAKHIDEAADAVDGHHRLYAAKILGIKNVPAEKMELLYKNYYTEKFEDLEGEFTLQIKHMVYDEKKPHGTILSQEPKEGTAAKAGSVIKVVISLGPEEAALPDVSGWPQEYAVKYLEALGYRTEILLVNISDYKKDLVEGTEPVAGKTVHIGDTITLRVSNVDPVEEESAE